jgi:hypothetical protein
MDCFKCRSKNPDGKKYCADCGSPLDEHLGAVQTYLESNLGQQVETFLDKRLKDQKMVETEVTEAVATKLLGWGKLFGAVIGIPLTVLAVVLGFLGIKSYSDFKSIVDTSKREISATFDTEKQKAQESISLINQQSDAFRKQAAEIEEKRKGLTAQYQELESQLAGARGLGEKLKTLTDKVDRIEKSLAPSGAGFKSELQGPNQYGSTSTILAIERLGKTWKTKHPDRPLSIVGNISRKGGGPIAEQKNHQDGRAFHIRPLTNNGINERTSVGAPNYSAELNRELVEMIKNIYPAATVFFDDPTLVELRLTKPMNRDHLCVRLP